MLLRYPDFTGGAVFDDDLFHQDEKMGVLTAKLSIEMSSIPAQQGLYRSIAGDIAISIPLLRVLLDVLNILAMPGGLMMTKDTLVRLRRILPGIMRN